MSDVEQLNYKDILDAQKNGDLLDWHPEYQLMKWKDGEAPLFIVHVSPHSDGVFVGYNCSNPECKYCTNKHPSNELGGHHQMIQKSGLSEHSKIEFIETKKRTRMEERDNPVFIKYKMIVLEDWSVVSTNVDPYIAPERIRLRLQGNVYGHPSGRFEDGKGIITSNVVDLDTDNNRAKTYSGNWYKLGNPDKEWLQWLRDNYGNKYLGKFFPN